MGEPVSTRCLTLSPAQARRLADLLAWDAPFLPEVTDVVGEPPAIEVCCREEGVPLAAVVLWPRGARAAVALQLVACATFLAERGFVPLRGLLRRARVTRHPGAVWLRLACPPRLHVDEMVRVPRLQRLVRAEEALVGRVLAPLVAQLLPERSARLATALERCAPWEAGQAALETLLADSRGGSLLAHPAGAGRALWARRHTIPETGVFWVEGDGVAGQLATAARLMARARGRPLAVSAGAIDEEAAARQEGAAALGGADSLVLTSVPLEVGQPLPLAEGEAVWILSPRGSRASEVVQAVAELGREQPALTGAVVEAAAATCFSAPPHAPVADRVSLAGPAARRALAWLESSPAGLTAEELELVGVESATVVPELARLSLAYRRDGVWHAVVPRPPEAGKQARLAELLPPSSPRGMVARAVATGDPTALLNWCEERLETGRPREVYALVRAAPPADRASLVAAEAALHLGRLKEAAARLAAVGEAGRSASWHVLRAWWAVATGAVALAKAELAQGHGATLPRRLAARVAWCEAQLAFLRGEREEEHRWFAEAARLAPLAVPDAVAEVTVAAGRGALRRARTLLGEMWGGDTTALVLYTLAARAWFRGCYAAAVTALHAALRLATGYNFKLLGEIHADLGASALQQERLEIADRHLLLAEQWLERAGSERATTVVRFNRAIIANDLLEWQRSRQLVLSVRERRGAGELVSTILEDLELLRADLVRGDVDAASAALPRLEEAAAGIEARVGLAQGLSAARAHIALAVGDLETAAAAAEGADESERPLLLAVVRAAQGVLPEDGLPWRWGLVVTGRLLARWYDGGEASAREELAHGLATRPREAAVGFARFVACLRRRGEALPPSWSALRVRAEQVLDAAGLDGWAGRLRRELGPDTLEVVRALDGVLGAGSDALTVPRLERLGRALQLGGLEVTVDGRPVAVFGDAAGGETLTMGGVALRVGGAVSEVARAALLLVLRQLPLLLGGEGGGGGGATSNLLGSSAALAAIREEIVRWAPLPAPVLLTGEPGTGKELVARELHRLSGRRGEFVAVNCAGIPATLLESELFGVARGAFTGADRDRPGLVEAAAGGTLFLDEVGELPIELQGKLLRLLQEREVRRLGATVSRRVDVRFVAATNRDLAEAIAAGTFRQDLYYRLAYAVIRLPPLRERPEDIETLAVHFVAELARSFQRPGVRLSSAALALLRQGQWPGNVRELESQLARAVAAARPGEVLGPDRFGELAARPAPELRPWAEALTHFRRSYFGELLAATGGNRSLAARRAGVSRQTLLYHLKELGLGERAER